MSSQNVAAPKVFNVGREIIFPHAQHGGLQQQFISASAQPISRAATCVILRPLMRDFIGRRVAAKIAEIIKVMKPAAHQSVYANVRVWKTTQHKVVALLMRPAQRSSSFV